MAALFGWSNAAIFAAAAGFGPPTVPPSHRRDSHYFTHTPSPRLLKHLRKVEGGAAEWRNSRRRRAPPHPPTAVGFSYSSGGVWWADSATTKRCAPADCSRAVDETVILLHPPLPLVCVSMVMKRERQQNGSLVRGYGALRVTGQSMKARMERAEESGRNGETARQRETE